MDNEQENISQSEDEPQEVSIRAVKRKDIGQVQRKKVVKKPKKQIEISEQLKQMIASKLKDKSKQPLIEPVLQDAHQQMKIVHKQAVSKMVKGVQVVYRAKRYPQYKNISVADKTRKACDVLRAAHGSSVRLLKRRS